MRRVVWLLDFDGVINATSPRWGRMPYQAHVPFWYGGRLELWKARWAPDLIRRIRVLHALSCVEVRWSSTWCLPDLDGTPQVRALERVLHLPELACAVAPSAGWSQGTMGAAKRLAALEVVQAGDDLIWTDDEWVPDPGDEVHDLLTRDGRNALLIRPSQNRGLTREDLARIEAWVNRP